MEPLRILVSNEPLLYRATIAHSLRLTRPGADVRVVGPDALDRALAELRPHLVFCTLVTPALRASATTRACLEPDGQLRAGRGDVEQPASQRADFDALLALIDASARLAQMSQEKLAHFREDSPPFLS